MAKRKKDKKKAQTSVKASEFERNGEIAGDKASSGNDGSARPGQKRTVGEDKAAKGNGAAERMTSPRKVGMATCCACMFLTFVLGIYLGTLVPGIINTAGKAGAPGMSAPPQKIQQADGQAPVAQPLDPQLKAAIADLEKKAAANPDSAPDWINLGNIYFDAHLPEDAIKAYERALTLAPRNADVLTDLGIMYREIGDFAKAVATFRKAIEVDPGHQNAMFNEGVVLSTDLHKNEEAAAAWQRLLDVNPGAVSPGGVPLAEMIKRLR